MRLRVQEGPPSPVSSCLNRRTLAIRHSSSAVSNPLPSGYGTGIILLDHVGTIHAFKIQNFGLVKTGICVIKLPTNTYTKFQSNIFIFDFAMVKIKTGKADDVTLKHSFWHF